MIIKINTPAVYSKINSNEMDVRAFPYGYQYIDKSGLIITSSLGSKVYRYAKNYAIDDVVFSMIMITLDNNSVDVEKYIDSMSKNVTLEQAKGYVGSDVMSFTYLNNYYGGAK